MPLVLDEQQTMLAESVREFLGQEAPVSHLRHLRDERHPDGLSLALWRKFGHMGYAGTLLPEAQGGMGLGHAEAAILMEELGRHLTPSPFWSTGVVGATAILAGGTPVQQQVLLPAVGAGETVLALALEERGRHDPLHIGLRAVPADGGFLLDGEKTFVVNGHIARTLLVVGRVAGQPGDEAGLGIFLVDPHSPGVQIERTVMVDGHNAARLRLSRVHVPRDAVLGEPGQAWPVLARVLAAGRLAAAAELAGISDEVLGRTLAHLRERVQFGRRIGEFQALQHRAARVHAQVEIARAIVMKAARALDAGAEAGTFLVSVAKAKAGTVATLAVQEAVQMHGGMGISDELDLGFFMKRARVLEELLGDHRFHESRIATLNGY